MFEETKVRDEWSPLKRAIWDVVTAAELNAPKYVNAYELTDKLFEAVKLKEEPSRWIVEEHFPGRPPRWVCVYDEARAREVYNSWRRYDDARVTMTPLYAGQLPLPNMGESTSSDFISRVAIAEVAERIAALAADPKESAAIKTEIARILQHVGFVAATRIKGEWERGMREAIGIATQRVEGDPEYRVYDDGDDIARDIREAIREHKP